MDDNARNNVRSLLGPSRCYREKKKKTKHTAHRPKTQAQPAGGTGRRAYLKIARNSNDLNTWFNEIAIIRYEPFDRKRCGPAFQHECVP